MYLKASRTLASESVCTTLEHWSIPMCATLVHTQQQPYMASSQALHLETLVHHCLVQATPRCVLVFLTIIFTKGIPIFRGLRRNCDALWNCCDFCMLLIIIVIDVLYIISFRWPGQPWDLFCVQQRQASLCPCVCLTVEPFCVELP